MEDHSHDSELIAPSLAPTDADLITPARRFKDKELWPLTLATELLLLQVKTTGEDTIAYEALAFAFIHQKRNGSESFDLDRPELFTLCWDINTFRREMFRWIETEKINGEDRAEARRIYAEVLAADRASEVEPVQKKTGGAPPAITAQPPPTSTSSSGS